MMMFDRRSQLFAMFRSERLLGVWVALLLLLVPFFHPMAEANAAGRLDAGIICSSFGSASGYVSPARADDCPMGIACCAAVTSFGAEVGKGWDDVDYLTTSLPKTSALTSTMGRNLELWSHPPAQGPPTIF
jgi:hypothetical protein